MAGRSGRGGKRSWRRRTWLSARKISRSTSCTRTTRLLVINKPAGLVVHPGSGNWQGTMLNALLHHAPQLAGIPRAGIVHRLDKDTSGLLVVAKTLTAQTDLVRQLQARTVKREYLAVVQGAPQRDGQCGCADRPTSHAARQDGGSAVRQTGSDPFRRGGTLRALQPGALPARNRAHAPDPRAHAAYRPSPCWAIRSMAAKA